MNTQLLVAEINSLISYINTHPAHSMVELYSDDDGYTDYDMAEYAVDNVEVSISYIFADAVNPTLPSLSRLADTARMQGYTVDYQAAA